MVTKKAYYNVARRKVTALEAVCNLRLVRRDTSTNWRGRAIDRQCAMRVTRYPDTGPTNGLDQALAF